MRALRRRQVFPRKLMRSPDGPHHLPRGGTPPKDRPLLKRLDQVPPDERTALAKKKGFKTWEDYYSAANKRLETAPGKFYRKASTPPALQVEQARHIINQPENLVVLHRLKDVDLANPDAVRKALLEREARIKQLMHPDGRPSGRGEARNRKTFKDPAIPGLRRESILLELISRASPETLQELQQALQKPLPEPVTPPKPPPMAKPTQEKKPVPVVAKSPPLPEKPKPLAPITERLRALVQKEHAKAGPAGTQPIPHSPAPSELHQTQSFTPASPQPAKEAPKPETPSPKPVLPQAPHSFSLNPEARQAIQNRIMAAQEASKKLRLPLHEVERVISGVNQHSFLEHHGHKAIPPETVREIYNKLLMEQSRLVRSKATPEKARKIIEGD